MSEAHFDVCVVGGGPAGSATATRLAKLGHSVCVVERSVFPRPHVGESLTPGIRAIFDVLGLSAPESDGFSASGESLIRWSDAQVERLAPDRHAGCLLVDRGKFDAFLMRAAKVNGVHVFQPARITKVERSDLGWRFEVGTNNSAKRLTAKFVVDAAGRRGFLPRKRRTVSPRTLALCGYVSSAKCPTATLVEAAPDCWCWGAPIPGGVFSAMVFLDQDTVRAERRNGLEFIWRSHLAKTKLFSGFSASNLIAGPIACDATTFFVEDPIEENLIRVGEACFALDPLSSTGVEKALQNGLVAATALHTILSRPDRKELSVRFYRARQNETVSSHAAWSSEYYGKVRRYAALPFWRKRTDGYANTFAEESVADPPIDVTPTLASKMKISAEAEIIDEACILGDEICSCPALSHPSLHRPVAFIEGVEVRWLLDIVRCGTDLRRLLLHWSNRISHPQAVRVAGWFLRKRILEAESGEAAEEMQ